LADCVERRRCPILVEFTLNFQLVKSIEDLQLDSDQSVLVLPGVLDNQIEICNLLIADSLNEWLAGNKTHCDSTLSLGTGSE
jgi:hypothetical protein